MTRSAGQVGRLSGQRVHRRSPLFRKSAEIVSSCPLLGVLQGPTELKKLVDLGKVGSGQKIHHPCGPGGTPKLADLLSQRAVTGLPCFGNPLGPSLDELFW